MLLTLDLSLNETGYCINANGTVKSGIIKPPKELTQYERIEHNLKAVLSLIEQFKIKMVGIESAAYGLKSSSMNILAEQQGVFKYELKKRNVGVAEINISSIKKFITGKGNAKKVDMINALRNNHNVLTKNNNECDAIGIYMYMMSQEAIATI
jgi:Holliday junction resolvasome RuvABC endonuclease subunit